MQHELIACICVVELKAYINASCSVCSRDRAEVALGAPLDVPRRRLFGSGVESKVLNDNMVDMCQRKVLAIRAIEGDQALRVDVLIRPQLHCGRCRKKLFVVVVDSADDKLCLARVLGLDVLIFIARVVSIRIAVLSVSVVFGYGNFVDCAKDTLLVCNVSTSA